MSTLAVQSENASAGLLDRAFGTLNATVDLWQRWQTGKVETQKARAEIPSSVVAPKVAGAAAVNMQTLLLYGGGAAAVFLLLSLLFRRKG